MSVADHTFRAAMARFPSGVTVVTAADGALRHGMTVSAFSAVSVAPPLVLVCLSESARTLPIIERSGRFAVHMLSTDQEALGRRFAGMLPELPDPFEGIAYTTAVTGSPILEGCVVWLDCVVHAVHVAGDHSVVIGQVEALQLDSTREPIVYHNRQWRQLS